MRGRGILCTPSVFSAADNESAKKLKYLKTPSVEKLSMSEKMSHFLRLYPVIRRNLLRNQKIHGRAADHQRKKAPVHSRKKVTRSNRKTFCCWRLRRQ